MNNISRILTLVLVLGVMLVGCSREESSPVAATPDLSGLQGPDMITLPSGITIVSAKLVLNNTYGAGQQVDVHRATAPWIEELVTWNNFANAYDPTILGSFVSQVATVQEIDITSLVRGWVDGTISNYGVVLKQHTASGDWSFYASSEDVDVAKRPKLIITYNHQGTVVSGVVQRSTSGEVSDAYVWATAPDYNTGTSEYLYSGFVAEGEKLALLSFDIAVADGGCTRTIGYWKTHPEMVAPFLPVSLGKAGGSRTMVVTTASQAVDLLSQQVYGTPSNGVTKLYAQLLAAKLNIKNGAGDAGIRLVVRLADAFLSCHSYNDWNSMSRLEKNLVLLWHRILDCYNNGKIGPKHCD